MTNGEISDGCVGIAVTMARVTTGAYAMAPQVAASPSARSGRTANDTR